MKTPLRVLRFLVLLLFEILLIACTSTPSPGTTQTSHTDGMMIVFIPAGEFTMGSLEGDSTASNDEKPQHTVYLDAYWIDQTEVTNAMYTRCLEAGECSPIVTPRPNIAEYPNHPIQGVTYFQAQSYCEWSGRRLPTEAEWEKAARGTDSRLYPWGSTSPDINLVNFDFVRGDVVDVGAFPKGASPYGVLDMAGNVWEWVSDWYSETYYATFPKENPQGPESGILRVLRGGAWNTNADAVRTTNRFWAFPGRNDFDGFRCAVSHVNPNGP